MATFVTGILALALGGPAAWKMEAAPAPAWKLSSAAFLATSGSTSKRIVALAKGAHGKHEERRQDAPCAASLHELADRTAAGDCSIPGSGEQSMSKICNTNATTHEPIVGSQTPCNAALVDAFDTCTEDNIQAAIDTVGPFNYPSSILGADVGTNGVLAWAEILGAQTICSISPGCMRQFGGIQADPECFDANGWRMGDTGAANAPLCSNNCVARLNAIANCCSGATEGTLQADVHAQPLAAVLGGPLGDVTTTGVLTGFCAGAGASHDSALACPAVGEAPPPLPGYNSPYRSPTPPSTPPTQSPSYPPTNPPTNLPTSPPTWTTTAPTARPTVIPTGAPTPSPTSRSPTGPPTRSPTTVAPTLSPSTEVPTAQPTASPLTLAPMDPPTNPPTDASSAGNSSDDADSEGLSGTGVAAIVCGTLLVVAIVAYVTVTTGDRPLARPTIKQLNPTHKVTEHGLASEI